MSAKENDTAAIFKTVVEIYESDYQLYRSSRSNKLKICSEVVSRSVSLQNSKNVSKTNSKKTEVGFQIDSSKIPFLSSRRNYFFLFQNSLISFIGRYLLFEGG